MQLFCSRLSNSTDGKRRTSVAALRAMFCRDSFTQVKQIIGIIFTSRTMKNSHRLFHTENTNEVGHFVSFVFDLSTGRIDLMDTNQMGLDNSVFYSRALLNDFFRDLHLSLIASDCSTPQPYLYNVGLLNSKFQSSFLYLTSYRWTN